MAKIHPPGIKRNGKMQYPAREAFLFCFLGLLIAGLLGPRFERPRMAAAAVPPCYALYSPMNDLESMSIGPCSMDGKLIPQLTISLCAGDLVNGNCSKLSAEGEAAEAAGAIATVPAQQVSRSLGLSAFFALVAGIPAGLAIWSVYRLARFGRLAGT